MADNTEFTPPLEDLDGAQPRSRLSPLPLVWRHKALVALGVVAGCVLGAIYYSGLTPIYQSSAKVLVVKKSPETLPVPGTEGRVTEDYLSTHQTLIRSPVIVSAAVQKANLRDLKSFAGLGDPTSEIIGSLKVSRELNAGSPTSILSLSYRSSNPEDAAVVVREVIDSYQAFLNAKYRNITVETAKEIKRANEILKDELNKKQEEYNRFGLEHPALLVRNKEGLSAVQDRLLSLEARRSALLLQETEVRGRLDAFEKAVADKRYTQPELLAMLSESKTSAGTTPAVNAALEERLTALEVQEASLLEDYGPDYPPLRSVRKQIALLRTQMARLGKAAESDETTPLDPIKTHILTLKMELENTRMAAQALSKLVQEEQLKTKEMRGIEKQDEAYRMEIARSEQLFNAISKRLNEVSLLQDFPGGFEAETIAPAGPGSKVAPRPVLVFGAAFLLGLLAGFGLASVAELSDQSFRTPEEIHRQLGMPVVGHIPFFESKPSLVKPAEGSPRLDPILCTLHHPKSRESEGYRGVRTALFFNAREGGNKVIQVTSPDMGDGKTTLAANLAVSIAQAQKKVLLIDADFRRPRLHKVFGVPATRGLATVINGEAELCEVIQETTVPGLFLLPCGPTPPNPAELLSLTRFHELLALLRDQYDFVIIDTPPLLAVTDPSVVVPYVDGVILTVRISKNARPHAMRARDILSTLGAQIIGVVVNAVGQDIKGYGYSSYNYGYSYKYYNYYAYDNEGAQSDSSPDVDLGAAVPGEGPRSGQLNGPRSGQQLNGPRSGKQMGRTGKGGRSRKRKSFLAWLFNR